MKQYDKSRRKRIKALYFLKRDSARRFVGFAETQAICPIFGTSYVNSSHEK